MNNDAAQPLVAVLGGGAAGFFGAIACAEANPNAQVILLEKTGKLLSKVRVSGGGRCNVTHACDTAAQLVAHYPRGNKQLKAAFQQFGVPETIAWFAKRGVQLKTEADGRMFPTTDSSETIAQALEQAARQAGVRILTNCGVEEIEPLPGGGFQLKLSGSRAAQFGTSLRVGQLLIATGGNPKSANYDWLRALGHTIAEPVPSLFTFNVPNSPLNELMGVSVPQARVVLAGEKLQYEGPLLVTHWGVSGPAVLKLSAWGARRLSELGYVGTALINWIPTFTEETLRPWLQQFRQENGKKTVAANPQFGLPQRLWRNLLEQAGIAPDIRWSDLPAKSQNRLLELLLRTPLAVRGKTTYKEEFVTCGGILLEEVDLKTMESRRVPGLYFAGEVLDVDGITGGFNFQAAWTTGFLAGRAMSKPGHQQC
ncbi:NAD(P)/FAD-dependent oxidoreductase [Hymenobacter sp. BT770]|uniref:NAD(P)/FAD-dependent oxidoreductase n=1 Tax=Hymenobacter sp. BT770 TaxID=2886942 RepID=UPI001D11BA5B|nr:NAD(P)/FAD-dependent oxidoreductase [Hymenobacter sp. BT770]MCC3153521.1 NAD(P)/FAD-dependent oxidoreductase [Hymenobacter sp. BT770]MDO3415758.1 NAD(P)/FAD-dependent oxidoreductase [Hymenobacter sp. BT770]